MSKAQYLAEALLFSQTAQHIYKNFHVFVIIAFIFQFLLIYTVYMLDCNQIVTYCNLFLFRISRLMVHPPEFIFVAKTEL